MPDTYTSRNDLYNEIDDFLAEGIFTEKELLNEFLVAMTTPELEENWEHIKRMWGPLEEWRGETLDHVVSRDRQDAGAEEHARAVRWGEEDD